MFALIEIHQELKTSQVKSVIQDQGISRKCDEISRLILAQLIFIQKVTESQLT